MASSSASVAAADGEDTSVAAEQAPSTNGAIVPASGRSSAVEEELTTSVSEMVFNAVVKKFTDMNINNPYQMRDLFFRIGFDNFKELISQAVLDEKLLNDIVHMNLRKSLIFDTLISRNAAGLALQLELGASPNLLNSSGETALIMACTRCEVDCVRVLVDAGADLDATAPDGSTALHRACDRPCEETVVLLLDAGARYDIRNKAGKRAFDMLRGEGQKPVLDPDDKASYEVDRMMFVGRWEMAGARSFNDTFDDYVSGRLPSARVRAVEIETTKVVGNTPFFRGYISDVYLERPWTTKNHRFFPADFREMVLNLLCHASRPSPTANATNDIANATADATDADLASADTTISAPPRPPSALLPVELWIQVFSHMHRDWLAPLVDGKPIWTKYFG